MPNFDITLNIYIFLSLIGGAFLVGYLPRKGQILKKQRKILQLEQEMVQAHAEILDAQRDYCKLEARVKDISSPVIPLKSNKGDDPPQNPLSGTPGFRNNRPTGTD